MSAAMRTGAGAGAGIGTGPRPPWKSSPYVPVDDDEPDPPPNANVRVPGAVGARKKGAALGVRTWLAVEATGEARVVEAGKQAIMRRTGLPARDLRILDPQLSYPSTVLGRERAIVVNLEHIKAIVTAHEVLLLNFRDAAVAPFVHELQRRLLHRHSAQEDVVGSSTEWTNADGVEDPKWSAGRPLQVVEDNDTGNSRSCAKAFPSCSGEDDKEKEQMTGHEPRVLPFEFIALEACLESACSCLENEATMLEKEAHPALDKLTSKISTLNLERVRQIKSRLVAINGRVQKVRDELEHLLDDDDDMAEMYLTDKLMQQDLSDGSSDSALYFQGTAMDDERRGADISSEENDIVQNAETDPHNDKNLHGLSEIDIVNADSHGTLSFSTRSSSKHLEVQELEMLLEAYFVQIDSTLNKLSTLREYVDDTEDYINIMLDDKQNHLLQMGVVLTTATLIVSAFVVLVGIFGMNIQVDLFDKTKSGTREFLWTVGSGAMGSVVLYVIAIAWCKQRRLLE